MSKLYHGDNLEPRRPEESELMDVGALGGTVIGGILHALALLGIALAIFLTPFLRTTMAAWLPRIAPADVANAAALSAFRSVSLPEMLRANLAHDI